MNAGAISVVMAVYNGQRFLREQIASVLPDLRAGDELIAIDDGSTDQSLSILGSSGSPLLKIVSNPRNVGVVRSFERGLRLARNEFVFLCDQDDIWCSGKRAAFVEAFQRDKSVSLVISDAEIIDASGQVVASSFMTLRGGFKGGVLATLWRNRYLGCALALRRSMLAAALPIPRWAPMHDMWLGVVGTASGRVVYLPQAYVRYRRHEGNVTPLRTRENWLRLIRWRLGLVAALTARTIAVRLGVHAALTDLTDGGTT